MTTTIEAPSDPALYAQLTPVDGEVRVEFYRRVAWPRSVPGRPGPAANRPPTPMKRHLGTVLVDAPFHYVADKVHAILTDLDAWRIAL